MCLALSGQFRLVAHEGRRQAVPSGNGEGTLFLSAAIILPCMKPERSRLSKSLKIGVGR